MESKLQSPKMSPVQFVDVFGECVVAVDIWDDHDTFHLVVGMPTMPTTSSLDPIKQTSTRSRKSRKSVSPTRKRQHKSSGSRRRRGAYHELEDEITNF